MNQKVLLLVLSTALSIVSFETKLLSIKADQALVDRLCMATMNPEYCFKCLKSDPSSTTATDIGIVQLNIVCATNDMDSLFQDTYKLKGNSSDPKVHEALEFCLYRFEYSKTMVNEISDKVKARDFVNAQGTINTGILGQLDSCRAFIKSKGVAASWDGSAAAFDIGYVYTDWNVVLSILNVLKK